MPQRASPLFLERRSYRRRRLMDALRLWPLLGAGLWMIPLLWPGAGADPGTAMPMSRALLYVFIVWAILIAGAVLFWSQLRRQPPEGEAPPPAARPGRR